MEAYMDAVIGVDVGTTGTKAVLMAGGKIMTSAYRGYEFHSAVPGWVEQDPEELWQAVIFCIRSCVDGCCGETVRALSLSTQGGSLIALDKEMKPVRPLISWMDIRAADQMGKIKASVGVDGVYLKAGWKPINCFNLLQILWLREHEPDSFSDVRLFCTVDAYMNGKLTGNFSGDLSNAGISLLYDIRERRWDPELLSLCGISEARLPAVQPSGTVIGRLCREAAGELGLSPDTEVYCGAHDQYCAAVGLGANHAGDMLLSCGTSWGITSIADTPAFELETYVSVSAYPDDRHWGLFAYTPAGGAAMKWFRNTLNFSANGSVQDYASIDAAVRNVPPGSNGVLVYPHFSGTSCPSWNSEARASVMGLSLSNRPADIARAAMEGVLFDMDWILDAFRSLGIRSEKCRALGGAARSAVWMQMAADILGVDVEVPSFVDAPAIGAAILAGKGAGLWPDFESGYRSICPEVRIFQPDPENRRLYHALSLNYRELFSRIHSS